jgi:hypothetical protein
MITKSSVVDHFGSVAKAAEFFDITAQAVHQWPEKIPRERELELMVRLPETFSPPKADQPAHAQAGAA